MQKHLIIYPSDPSTSFLLTVFNKLQGLTKNVDFYHVLPTEESHQECKSLIQQYNTITFMGHGSHRGFSGARDEDFTMDTFLNSEDLKRNANINWIGFSCNSYDFLKKCNNSIGGGIGFGDLPTDFNDVTGAREFDNQAYKGINNNIIDGFKESLNWIIQETILSYSNHNLTIREIYNRCKILVTKRMVELIINSHTEDDKYVALLLFEMKRDMGFF